MTHKEIKEQLNIVLSALDMMPVTGRQTVHNMSACMRILENITASEIECDTCKGAEE